MTEPTPMMKCGHAANAVDGAGNKCCVICHGDPNSSIRAEPPPLEVRTARCSYFASCGSAKPSSTNMAFFEHRPNAKHDQYYCGCFGWD